MRFLVDSKSIEIDTTGVRILVPIYFKSMQVRESEKFGRSD